MRIQSSQSCTSTHSAPTRKAPGLTVGQVMRGVAGAFVGFLAVGASARTFTAGPALPPAPAPGPGVQLQPCGGNMLNAPSCPEDTVCVPYPGQRLPFGDVGGFCAQACSGDMGAPQACPPGLTCEPWPGLEITFSGVGGYCAPGR